ncbi:hypothetical protein Ancab_035685 [Ancistrocladus abbreviatus]
MSCKVEACEECTQNCLLIHKQKHDPSPIVTSFFKVMMGDQFSEALFVPARFAQTLTSLVDKETCLEDSSGRQWTVTLSCVDGYLAFQQGWHAFSLDHGIELGDFLVFHYIMGSHFVVHIYGKSGCEKLKFLVQSSVQNKRTKTTRDSVAKDGQCNRYEKESRKQQSNASFVSGSDVEIIENNGDECVMAADDVLNHHNNHEISQNIPSSGYCEESYFLLNRDAGFSTQDDRNRIFDLSDFEMPGVKPAVNQTCKDQRQGNNYSHDPGQLLIAKTEAHFIEEDPMVVEQNRLSEDAYAVEKTEGEDELHISEKHNNRVVPLVDFKISSCAVMDKNHNVKDPCGKGTSEQPLTATHRSMDTVKLKENTKGYVGMATDIMWKAHIAEGKTPIHLKNEELLMARKEGDATFTNSQSFQQKLDRLSKTHPFHVATGERLKAVKQEQIEFAQEISGNGEEPDVAKGDTIKSSMPVRDANEVHEMVKEEPFDLIDFPSPLAVKISCFVTTESASFLELPRGLPSCPGRGRPSSASEKVVLLRDPVMRLWPVLYHEKHGFKVLTSGWEAFRKANNIQPGDECSFVAENEVDGIYAVQIIHK